MIDWTNEKIAELIALARGAAVLIAIATVAYAYAKTRSLTTLLVAALTAGFFLWTVNNTDWWQQKVEEESTSPPGEVRATGWPGPAGGDGQLVLGPVELEGVW